MEKLRLTTLQKDVLQEMANIAAGNAATAMSVLKQEKIAMQVPAVHFMTVDELIDKIGGPEKEIVAVICKVKGEITGTIYFILTLEEAEEIVEQLSADTEIQMMQSDEMQAYATSLLKEVANILTGSYISALADFTSLHIQPTSPMISMDMAGAILVTGFVEISKMIDYALMMDTTFGGIGNVEQAKGHFLLMPDQASVEVLLSTLGISHE